jgi:hypothetical protein
MGHAPLSLEPLSHCTIIHDLHALTKLSTLTMIRSQQKCEGRAHFLVSPYKVSEIITRFMDPYWVTNVRLYTTYCVRL